MRSPAERVRAMLTPGHAAAFAAILAVVYHLWGRFFVPGGTGSNVVLGLLVVVAALYLGTTHFGPIVDDLRVPAPRRELRRRLRELRELERDVGELLKRARKGQVKKLDAAGIERVAAAHAAFSAATSDAAAAERSGSTDPAILDTLTQSGRALDDVLAKELGTEKTTAALLSQMKSLGLAFGVAVALRLFLVAPFQIPSGSMIPTLLIGDHLFVFRASYGLQSPVGDQPSYLVRWSMPEPGDVIVFQAPPWVPRNGGEDWIKRVVAGPGQRVKRVDRTLYVDGKPYTLEGEGKMMRYMDFEETGGGGGRWHEAVAMWHREDVAGRLHDTLTDIPPVTGDWPNAFEPRPDQRGLSCTRDECTVEDGFVFVMGDNRDHSSDGRFWGAVPVENVRGRAVFIWVSVDGSEDSVRIGHFTLPRFRWDRMFDAIP